MKIWNFGIIGCGSIADSHIKAIQNMENARLAAVSSRTENRVREVAKQEQCDWTVNYHDLLSREDIDIVCVTTSSGSHAEIGEQVLKAGKHLLMEKPLAMSSDEAENLIVLAKKHKVTLSVISQIRFKTHIQEAKRMIELGKLGKLTLIEVFTPYYRTQDYYDSAAWRGTLKEDGGALLNQGIHFIDIMLWLGGKVNTVIGKTETMLHNMEAEDIGLAILQFEQGALGTIMASTNCKPGYPQSIRIYGERGNIKLTSNEITEWFIDGVPEPKRNQQADTKHGGSDPKEISYEYHQKQIKDVIYAIEHHTHPLVTGEDGRSAVKLIESIYESNRLKQEVSV
jgi:UDP-N-acetyl-2-amino-2-deoxyglucuronate dehydrogenase